MDEPPLKKSRAESDFDGDGLDALSELEKLEPLTSSAPDSENASGSIGGSGGPSGSTPQQAGQPQGTPQPVSSASGFNLQPGQGVPPASTASSGGSVLQELLMNQPQGATNSPRPPAQAYPGAQQQAAFNRSPHMHNGSNTILSPSNSIAGRVPGPSPGGAPQAAQLRNPQPGMFAPGSGEQGMMMGAQGQHYPPGMMHRYPYGQAGPAGAMPQGYPAAAAAGRGTGAMGRGAMMNGTMGRGAPLAAQGRGAGMAPGQIMPRGMMEGPYAQNAQFVSQRPDASVFMQQTFGRGQHQAYQMIHPQQQMMLDANGQPVRPPGGQMIMSMANGTHPSMAQGVHPPGNSAAAAAAAAAAAQQQAQQREQEAQRNGRGRATPVGALPNPQDPEKRKLIQQQLVLLLHAHKCHQRERENQESTRNNSQQPHPPCNLPHCSTMKDVLQHMTTCNNGRACPFAHCASSRQIIAHWKNCSRDDCPVCKPLKKIQDTPLAFNQLHNLITPKSANGGASNGNGATNGSVDSMGQFGSPVMARGGLTNSLFEGYNGDPFRLPNAPNQKLSGPPSQGARADRANGDIPNLPPPDVPETEKEWHLQVTKDLRNHLVGKLVKAIFPEPDPCAMNDNRLKELIAYARKVEKEMFESANDREEYYHLLAEKIYKIQKELQEKKNARLNQGVVQHEAYHLQSLDIAEVMGVDQQPGQSQPQVSQGEQRMPIGSDQPSTSGAMDSAMHQQQQQQPWMNVPMTNQPQAPMPNQQTGQQQQPNSGAMFPNSGNSTPSLMQQTPTGVSGVTVKEEESAPSTTSVTHSNGPSSSIMQNGSIKKEEIEESPSMNCDSTTDSKENVKKEETTTSGKTTPAVAAVPREKTPPPADDTVFTVEELKNFLLPVWDKLDKSEDAIPFRVPVDPVALNIPDYHQIVHHPMDLETICKKLRCGKYKNAWEFCDDIWLMFDNAWLYNRKNSKVYKYGTKLSEMFVSIMDPVMKAMGYCCAKKLSFTPLALFCYGAPMCTIARDQTYFVYETCSSQFNVVVSERYTYCTKCFEALPPEGISLSENPNDRSNMAPKEKFLMMKNNIIDWEPFENCKYCHRKWHRICALHDKKVFPEGFICESCRASKKYIKQENKFLAKKLPHNKLSTFLEDRVNGYIKKQLQAEADKYQVVIRTLCVQDKEVEVKQQMKTKYCTQDNNSQKFPEKFPYRTKAVFAFEIIDGVEVCFFGLHVQEYGSNCPAPNARRVYIAYLDSVHFFQPRELRTDVYHEILLGYLDYAKRLGYTMAHIWACPPSEGDDYIFHCHPPEQKIPKPKRLQDWYKKMLEKGVHEKTVVEFKDIYKQARDDNLISPTQLPYFEGDFWPNVIEDCIREASNEEAQRKVKEEDGDDGEEDSMGGGSMDGTKNKKQNKKNSLKKSAKNSKKKQGSITGNEVTDRLYSQLDKHKEVFFTIRLVSQQSELSVIANPISDPDPLMSSEMMDGRDTFLTRARDEHWEFSSLRRAKYSTLCLTHALHESDSKGMDYTCNRCNGSNAKWHCNTCEDFDLCDDCKAAVKHDHPLEQIKSLVADTASDAAGGNNRFESIQRCIQSLVHACQCRDANCRRMSCHKMKRVVQHTKMCKKRVNGTCPVCKQLIALCCYHAKHCSRDTCSVPFCMNIRQKLAEQRRTIQRRADMMMRRRMEGLQAGVGGASTSAAPPTPATPNAGSVNVPTPPSNVQNPGSVGLSVKGGGVGASQLSQSNAMGGSAMSGMGQQMTSLGGVGPGTSGMGQQNAMGMKNAQMQQRFIQFDHSGKGGGVMSGQQMQSQQMFPGLQRPGMGMMTPAQQQQQQQQQQQMQAGRIPGAYPGVQQPGYQMAGMGMQGGGGPAVNDPSLQSQLAMINTRLKKATTDAEKAQVFTDLKKTPHLFNAYLRVAEETRENSARKMPPNNGTFYSQYPEVMGQPGMRGGPPGGAHFAGGQQPRGPSGQFAPMTAAQQQAWQNQQMRQQGMPFNQQNRQQMLLAQQMQQQQQHQSNAGGQQ